MPYMVFKHTCCCCCCCCCHLSVWAAR